MGFFDFFSRQQKETLDKGLEKTKEGVFSKITRAFLGKSKVDDAFLDELEEILISGDVGVKTTLDVVARIQKRAKEDKFLGSSELNAMLREEIKSLFNQTETSAVSFDLAGKAKPHVIMVVGVNGVGKTTTIGKLAHQFKQSGKKVVLGAADTFRAAAVEQLIIWGKRAEVDVVNLGMNTDPSAVAFETLQHAVTTQADVVIIDTAGRLHNKVNLMSELAKVKRVMQKIVPDAPHEILLVLDASTGQNAFEQTRQFIAATEVNALALTKLDGTAKGGVVIGVSYEFGVPVKYIGVGEGINDLQIFNKDAFVDALFGDDE